jgi:C-terminal processing protease CtpA/Prc
VRFCGCPALPAAQVRKLSGAEATLSLPRPTRAPLPSPVSSTAAHGGGDAVIRLRSFTARAQRDVAAALRELGLDDASGGTGNGGGEGGRRLVLDLRGNRGGLVSEGAEVARLFLGGGSLPGRWEPAVCGPA